MPWTNLHLLPSMNFHLLPVMNHYIHASMCERLLASVPSFAVVFVITITFICFWGWIYLFPFKYSGHAFSLTSKFLLSFIFRCFVYISLFPDIHHHLVPSVNFYLLEEVNCTCFDILNLIPIIHIVRNRTSTKSHQCLLTWVMTFACP